MNNALFGSKPESKAMQDLVDLCHDTIGYEQQVVDSGLEARILDLMGAYRLLPSEPSYKALEPQSCEPLKAHSSHSE